MGKCDKEYYKKFEEREPTMVYKKGATTVKVYGELDVKRFAEGLYKLYLKYSIK